MGGGGGGERIMKLPTSLRCGLGLGAVALVLASMMVVLPQTRHRRSSWYAHVHNRVGTSGGGCTG